MRCVDQSTRKQEPNACNGRDTVPWWASEVIEEVLWEEAETRRKEMESRGETPLCIWDSSVLEKPESEKLEGLGSVRSSRVRRLARSRQGVFNRPSGMEVACARL